MIDREGNIFGIKGYGQIHRGHYYGTLDTIENWYWGDYAAYPRKKDPERDLRELWDRKGVPKERQDEIIMEATGKAQPGSQIGPFTLN
jgi:hypothetical protein